jgi:phage baseplate assembly protein W
MTTLSGFRLVTVRKGDTLQGIAARALGDATKWRLLVWINGLTYPYITDNPSLASATVLQAGSLLKVPASATIASTTSDPNVLFGIDLALVDGDLAADDGGDFLTVSGVANLQQALEHRLETPLSELVFHLDYGNGVYGLIGGDTGPTSGLLSEQYVSSCLSADPRVKSVASISTTVKADGITSLAVVNPIVGAPVTVSSET